MKNGLKTNLIIMEILFIIIAINCQILSNENLIRNKKNKINKRSLDMIEVLIDDIINGEETKKSLSETSTLDDSSKINSIETITIDDSSKTTTQIDVNAGNITIITSSVDVINPTNLVDIINTTSSDNITIITSSVDVINETSSGNITNITSSVEITNVTSLETNYIITTSDSSSYENSTLIANKKSNSGLSTGAICGIVIPCVAALIGVAAAAALCQRGVPPPRLFTPSIPPLNYIDTSLDKFNVVPVVQQPIQPAPSVPIVTPEPQPIIQPKIIEPPPVRPIIRPNYPVTAKLDPPLVNRAFQPIYPAHQGPIVHAKGVKMMPVQEVKMVPMQQVDMVPVHEIIPDVLVHDNVPSPHLLGVNQSVPVQNIFQMNHFVPFNAGTDVASEVAQVSQVPAITELMPEGNQIGTALFSHPKIFNGVPQIGPISSPVIPGSEVSPQIVP